MKDIQDVKITQNLKGSRNDYAMVAIKIAGRSKKQKQFH